MVDDIADYMGELTAELEQLTKDYPSLRIDLKPLPAIVREHQAAATAARIRSFAPIVGRTGADFNRTLLLTLYGALNQLRHLAQVIAKAERSDGRAKFLRNASDRMDALYDDVARVLNERYFQHDTYNPPGEAK